MSEHITAHPPVLLSTDLFAHHSHLWLCDPVPLLWKTFLYDGKTKCQSTQDSGEGKSNGEKGRCLADVKAHLAERKELW